MANRQHEDKTAEKLESEREKNARVEGDKTVDRSGDRTARSDVPSNRADIPTGTTSPRADAPAKDGALSRDDLRQQEYQRRVDWNATLERRVETERETERQRRARWDKDNKAIALPYEPIPRGPATPPEVNQDLSPEARAKRDEQNEAAMPSGFDQPGMGGHAKGSKDREGDKDRQNDKGTASSRATHSGSASTTATDAEGERTRERK